MVEEIAAVVAQFALAEVEEPETVADSTSVGVSAAELGDTEVESFGSTAAAVAAAAGPLQEEPWAAESCLERAASSWRRRLSK